MKRWAKSVQPISHVVVAHPPLSILTTKLVDFLPKGEASNSEVCSETLRNSKAKIRLVRPNLDMANVLLQHDNARPHTIIRTMEAIISFGWTVIPHLLYSPDLAPSDYQCLVQWKKDSGATDMVVTMKWKLLSWIGLDINRPSSTALAYMPSFIDGL